MCERPDPPATATNNGFTNNGTEETVPLGRWFHNLHLPDGTQTAPNHPFGDFPAYKWAQLADHIPRDLTGWRALDIGCNAGFYTFELAKRGAHVTAIDADARYLAQAKWAAARFHLEESVTFRQMQVYDLAHVQTTFDLVLFMGVFYHLRYPTLALDIVAPRLSRMMIFQTLTVPGAAVYEQTGKLDFSNRALLGTRGWPSMAYIEGEFAGDPTNWWVPNHACVEALLRTSGLRVTSLGHEMYLCTPDPEHPAVAATWAAGELRAVIGQKDSTFFRNGNGEESMMSNDTKTDHNTRTTTERSKIQQWVQERDGVPAVVKGTEILRIDFLDDEDASDEDESLKEISWNEFFRIFDDRELVFLYQEETSDGDVSRFSKFVTEKTAQEAEQA